MSNSRARARGIGTSGVDRDSKNCGRGARHRATWRATGQTESFRMPLYEYICKDCGSRFEVMRRMSERNDAPDCEKCGSADTALALSATAFLGATVGGGNDCSTSAWTGGG